MISPLPTSWRPLLHVNRFGLILKGHNNGKFRLITDISFGISSDYLVSLSYITVDDVAEIVQELGRGTLLAKMDIEAAYWLLPVHPQNRMEWNGMVYVDLCFPFGLWPAPKVVNAVADALCWCLQQAGIQWVMHYLDDFIIVAPPDLDKCSGQWGSWGTLVLSWVCLWQLTRVRDP